MAAPDERDEGGPRRRSPVFVWWRAFLGAGRALTGPWTRANAASWLKLIVLILVLRWGFVELYSIPSGSMEPVLHGDPRFLRGDRVAVNKLLFGPRIPFTTLRLFRMGEPLRWDIVVFNAVDPDARHKTLIKRVAGLPGERIHIADGYVHADGVRQVPPPGLAKPLKYTTVLVPSEDLIRERFLQLAKSGARPPGVNPANENVRRLGEDVEWVHERVKDVTLAGLSHEEEEALLRGVAPASLEIVKEWLSQEYSREKPFRFGIREEDEYAVVPEGHYFMLGDNSGNSLDGRYFGWVPHENLYGRAFAVALPFSRMKDLSGFSSTWWGLGLLWGLPALAVLWELVRSFFVFSWRVRRVDASSGFVRGERVVVNRVAFGLRFPFTGRRVFWTREPGPGDVVAYLGKIEDGATVDLCFGRVVGPGADGGEKGEEDRNGGGGVLVEYSSEEGTGQVEVEPEVVVGRAVAVWWPLRRRRRFPQVNEGESAPG